MSGALPLTTFASSPEWCSSSSSSLLSPTSLGRQGTSCPSGERLSRGSTAPALRPRVNPRFAFAFAFALAFAISWLRFRLIDRFSLLPERFAGLVTAFVFFVFFFFFFTTVTSFALS